jgi:hypothetical protein
MLCFYFESNHFNFQRIRNLLSIAATGGCVRFLSFLFSSHSESVLVDVTVLYFFRTVIFPWSKVCFITCIESNHLADTVNNCYLKCYFNC